MTQLSNGKFPYCGNAFYSIHLRSVSRLICFPSQFLSLLNFTSLGRLGELSKVMQTRNAVVGLHNLPEFFQSPSGM